MWHRFLTGLFGLAPTSRGIEITKRPSIRSMTICCKPRWIMDNNNPPVVTCITGVATMFLSFVDSHAAAIGALCSLCSFVVYAVTSYSKWKYFNEQRKANKAVDGGRGDTH